MFDAEGKTNIQYAEVSTVDGFQGREKEVIILSLVRANPKKEVGFLSDERRLNVAITRAKRLLIIVGDSSTTTTQPFIKTIYDSFASNGVVHTTNDAISALKMDGVDETCLTQFFNSGAYKNASNLSKPKVEGSSSKDDTDPTQTKAKKKKKKKKTSQAEPS